jgi:transcriptional regulator with XRE-family HTH domain
MPAVRMNRLRYERESRNLTQLALAHRAGVNPSEISKIENNRIRPYLPVLERLAAALGLTTADAQSLTDDVTMSVDIENGRGK